MAIGPEIIILTILVGIIGTVGYAAKNFVFSSGEKSTASAGAVQTNPPEENTTHDDQADEKTEDATPVESSTSTSVDSGTVRCAECGTVVNPGDERCYNCNYSPKLHKKRVGVIAFIAGILISLTVVGAILGFPLAVWGFWKVFTAKRTTMPIHE